MRLHTFQTHWHAADISSATVAEEAWLTSYAIEKASIPHVRILAWQLTYVTYFTISYAQEAHLDQVLTY